MPTVTGKIVDAKSFTPIGGATISVTGGDGSDFSQLNTETDTAGNFLIVDPVRYPVCCKFFLLIEADGYISRKEAAEWLQQFSSSKDMGTIALSPVGSSQPVTTTTNNNGSVTPEPDNEKSIVPALLLAGVGAFLIYRMKKKKR